MPFVYHLCSADFRGSTLYPLNSLKHALPDVYERERSKYRGRESVVGYRPPYLNVAWGDTVNLSALDPRLLVDIRRQLGIPVSRLLARRLARIPVERLDGMTCVVYDGATHWLNSSPASVPRVPAVAVATPAPTRLEALFEAAMSAARSATSRRVAWLVVLCVLAVSAVVFGRAHRNAVLSVALTLDLLATAPLLLVRRWPLAAVAVVTAAHAVFAVWGRQANR